MKPNHRPKGDADAQTLLSRVVVLHRNGRLAEKALAPATAGDAAELGDSLYDAGCSALAELMEAIHWLVRVIILDPAARWRCRGLDWHGLRSVWKEPCRRIRALRPEDAAGWVNVGTHRIDANASEEADPAEVCRVSDRDPERRLRVGSLSSDFQRYPGPGYHFLQPLIEGQSRTVAEVTGYPGCVLRYRPADSLFVPAERAPRENTGHLTFGSFNNVTKINASTIGLWASLLEAVGADALVSGSDDTYLALGVRLAEDQAFFSEQRAGLRARMASSPLMDEAGYARAVETGFRTA